MSKKFTGITSAGSAIPVYDKGAHEALSAKLDTSALDDAISSAVSGKQDTLTFDYNEDDAISAINGSALAGQGGTVELSSRTILVDDNLIDTTLSARKVTYLNCWPDGTAITSADQMSGRFPYDLSGSIIPSFTSTCYNFQYMNQKTNQSGASGYYFSPLVFHKDDFTESGDYYVKEITLADGLWESNQIEFLHNENSGLQSWNSGGGAFITPQQNPFAESGYNYCPVPFSGEMFDASGNVFSHTNFYFEGGSGGPTGPYTYSGGWAIDGAAYVGPVNARIIIPKSGFDYWSYSDEYGYHYVANSADIPEGAGSTGHYKMSGFALTAYITPNWAVSGIAYSQPTYIVDEQRLKNALNMSSNWNNTYYAVYSNSANWNQASAANATVNANADYWSNKQDQVLTGYDSATSALWIDIPNAGAVIGTATSSLNVTYSGTNTLSANFNRSMIQYGYYDWYAYYPFTASSTSGTWRVSAATNGWSAGIFTASSTSWTTANALTNSIAYAGSNKEKSFNFSGMTPGLQYYVGITGFRIGYNDFTGCVSGTGTFTSAGTVSGILAGGGVDPSLMKETSAGANIDISETNDAIIISGKDWNSDIVAATSGKADTSGFQLDGDGHISAYNGSAFAGQGGGDYVPLSAANVSIGNANTAATYSFAQGYQNKADGYSFAQCYKNSASYTAFAQGESNSAETKAFAQGYNNKAYNGGLAQGQSNKATWWSFTQGDSNTAAWRSIAQGYNCSADTDSFANGINNTAYDHSLAQGGGSIAKSYSLAQGGCTAENYSIAQGDYCKAYSASQAFGRNVFASGDMMAIGKYNKISANAAFVIGNGSGYQASARSDLFVIDKSGNVSALSGKFYDKDGEVGGGGGGGSYTSPSGTILIDGDTLEASISGIGEVTYPYELMVTATPAIAWVTATNMAGATKFIVNPYPQDSNTPTLEFTKNGETSSTLVTITAINPETQTIEVPEGVSGNVVMFHTLGVSAYSGGNTVSELVKFATDVDLRGYQPKEEMSAYVKATNGNASGLYIASGRIGYDGLTFLYPYHDYTTSATLKGEDIAAIKYASATWNTVSSKMATSALGFDGNGNITGYNGSAFAGGGGGATYSAGANIDITDNVISGRDWTDDIASATSGLQPSGDYASASDIPQTKSLSAGNGIDIAISNNAVTFSFTGIQYTASLPQNPDANTLYLIPEA